MGEKIFIRDKRTGQTALMSSQMLDHPHWAEHFEEVRTGKPVNEDLRRTSTRRLTEPAPNYYDQFTVDELRADIETRNAAGSEIVVEGTKKADLIAALDADDVAAAEKGNI